jgi:hypothetical protein
MSIRVMKCYEPRLDIEPNRNYVCPIGGSSLTLSRNAATSVSSNQIQWTITTPSTRTGIDRRVDIDSIWTLTYNATAGMGGTLANPVTQAPLESGPRQYPLQSCVQVSTCRLNDQLFSWQPSELITALQQYGNETEDRQYHCASPHYPDQFASYQLDNLNAGSRNPYANYFSNYSEDTRSIQFWVNPIVTNPSTGLYVYTIRVREPLFMSPFYWGREDYQALYGIQKIDLTLTMTSNLQRFWGGFFTNYIVGGTNPMPNPGQYDYAFTVQLSQAPGDQVLWLNYITPQPEMIIPSRLVYPYYQVTQYTQDFNFSVSGAEPNLSVQPFPLTTNNIVMHEIPKRVYTFAKAIQTQAPTGYATNYAIPDYYATISAATLNFDNVDGNSFCHKADEYSNIQD